MAERNHIRPRLELTAEDDRQAFLVDRLDETIAMGEAKENALAEMGDYESDSVWDIEAPERAYAKRETGGVHRFFVPPPTAPTAQSAVIAQRKFVSVGTVVLGTLILGSVFWLSVGFMVAVMGAIAGMVLLVNDAMLREKEQAPTHPYALHSIGPESAVYDLSEKVFMFERREHVMAERLRNETIRLAMIEKALPSIWDDMPESLVRRAARTPILLALSMPLEMKGRRRAVAATTQSRLALKAGALSSDQAQFYKNIDALTSRVDAIVGF